VGNSGGNPRAVIVPYDRDSRTRQFEASAIWATKKAQANISFWYSKYDNASESMTWQNPYAAPGAWPPVSGFPTGSGRLGLAPENDFWQLKGTGAWNLDRKNRLTGTLSYSIMKRDGAFLPYTVNAIPTPTPLPRASLDGEIKNTLFDLSWITRPMPKVSLKLNYHYTHQDNKTPQDWYSYIGGDASTQTVIPPGTDPNTVVSGRVRRNLPPGKEENRFKIDGDYAIARGTLLRAWYQYKKIDYEEASERLRSDTDNNELGVELRRTMSAEFTGWLRYVHDKRRGSDFSTDRPYQAGYSNGYVFAPFVPPAGGNRVDNIPTLRQSFVADYDKDLLTVFGNYNPADRVSLGLRGDWHSKKYKGPDCGGPSDQLVAGTGFIFPPECLGRQKTEGSALTLDGSYTPADGWNTFAFYTYQTYKTEQTGRAFSGTGTELAQATDPTRNWSHTIKQEDDTLGMGVRYRPSDKRWDAGAQYVYTQGRGKYNSVAGTSLPEFPGDGAPDTVSKVNSLQLFGTYKHSKSVLFRFNYWYEKLKSDDWAYDFATPTSSSNVVLTGQQAPKYENHVIGVSVAFTNF
jgi:predicted porin